MAHGSPTADELRDSLHRNKPGRLLESMGLLVVIGCTVAGTVIAYETGGPASALLLGAGALLGLTASVLAYWLVLYLLGYHQKPVAFTPVKQGTEITSERRQVRARNYLSSDERIRSKQHEVRELYTEADFPCPPSKPGRHSQVGSNFCDFYHQPGETAFAVVQPDYNASSQELTSIGERLQAWQNSNAYVKRILGLEQLLQGTLPSLRADIFSLAAREDRVHIALVYVAEHADNEAMGDELIQVMEGLPVHVVSPGYFSMLRS